MLPVTAVSESHVGLYLAFYFPCAAAAPSSDKAVCCSPDPCSRIPRIQMLVRGGAELSKGFFCVMQTQNYLGRDLLRAGKKCPARSRGWRGAGSWLRCGAGRVENGCGIFPCDGLRSGSFCACSGALTNPLKKCRDSRGFPKSSLWLGDGFRWVLESSWCAGLWGTGLFLCLVISESRSVRWKSGDAGEASAVHSCL